VVVRVQHVGQPLEHLGELASLLGYVGCRVRTLAGILTHQR